MDEKFTTEEFDKHRHVLNKYWNEVKKSKDLAIKDLYYETIKLKRQVDELLESYKELLGMLKVFGEGLEDEEFDYMRKAEQAIASAEGLK